MKYILFSSLIFLSSCGYSFSHQLLLKPEGQKIKQEITEEDIYYRVIALNRTFIHKAVA